MQESVPDYSAIFYVKGMIKPTRMTAYQAATAMHINFNLMTQTTLYISDYYVGFLWKFWCQIQERMTYGDIFQHIGSINISKSTQQQLPLTMTIKNFNETYEDDLDALRNILELVPTTLTLLRLANIKINVVTAKNDVELTVDNSKRLMKSIIRLQPSVIINLILKCFRM